MDRSKCFSSLSCAQLIEVKFQDSDTQELIVFAFSGFWELGFGVGFLEEKLLSGGDFIYIILSKERII